jgi:putative transposase
MPQSIAQIYVHIIFSTKDRYPFIDEAIENQLYAYIGEIIVNLNGIAFIINGTADHIHILMCMPRTESLSKCLEQIKKNSSKWIKTKADGGILTKFQWQRGYGAFSVSSSQRQKTIEYIKSQKQHHTRVTFKQEYLSFLKRYNVEFAPEYVWD